MKKNVLITVYDMEIGGIERSLINMLECFDYDAFEVDLLVFCHQGDFMELIPPQVNLLPEQRKYTVFRKPLRQCVREGHYAAATVRMLAKAAAGLQSRARRLKEGSGYIQMQLAAKYIPWFVPKLGREYDLCISYAWPHNFALHNVKARRKAAWVHTDFSELEVNNRLDLAAWKKFDHIVAVSDACSRSFATVYPSLEAKVTQIENITSPDFIRQQAACEAWPVRRGETEFHIVSVGRLSYAKGYDMAVRALGLLHERGMTDIKWHVVGYGGYEEELRRLIAEHGLQSSFHLLGKRPNPYPYIKACDLYVQPSRYEGKAVTVTEAQILGKTVLITNYSTAASQVTDGSDGFICEASPEGIAGAVARLYANPELGRRLGRNIGGKDYGNRQELEKLYRLIPAASAVRAGNGA